MAPITSLYTTEIIHYHPKTNPDSLKPDLISQIIEVTNGAYMNSIHHTSNFGFTTRFSSHELFLSSLTETGAWVVVARNSTTGRVVGAANFKLDCTGMDAQPIEGHSKPDLGDTQPGKDPYRQLYLSALAVDYTLKRSGLGGVLMNSMEKYVSEELEVDRVEEDSKRRMTCWVMDHESRANELFYIKNGYKEVEKKHITHRPWGSLKDFWWIQMEKEFTVRPVKL